MVEHAETDDGLPQVVGASGLQIRSRPRSARAMMLLVGVSFRVGGCCHSLADASTIHTAVPGVSLAINGAGKRSVL